MDHVQDKAQAVATTYAETTRKASLRVSGTEGGISNLRSLRQMAMIELKREHIGVRREGYDFIVDPSAIQAFVDGYKQVRPDLQYFEPKLEQQIGIGKREIKFLEDDQKRIARENASLDKHEANVLKQMQKRRLTTRRLIEGAFTSATDTPQIEKVSTRPQPPKIEGPSGLQQLSFAI